MNRLVSLFATVFVLAAFAFPNAALAGKKVVFGNASVAEGQVFDATSSMKLHLDANIDFNKGGAQASTVVGMSEADERIVTVAAVKGGKPIETRVQIIASTASSEAMGKSQEVTHPSVGKTFVVSNGESGHRVLTDDGRIVTSDQLPRRLKSMGLGPTGENKDFGGKTYQVGETIDLASLGSSGFLKPDDSERFSVQTATITLKRVIKVDKRKVALFAVVMTMLGDNDGMRMNIDLTGEMRVDVARGWPTHFEIAGPVVLNGDVQSGPQENMKITGTGTMSVAFSTLLRE